MSLTIGNGWTKTKEAKEGQKQGDIYISFVLDDTLTELIPQLKNCGLIANYVPNDQRKSDKSPTWVLKLYARNNSTSDKKTDESEKVIKGDIQEYAEEEINPDEIPF